MPMEVDGVGEYQKGKGKGRDAKGKGNMATARKAKQIRKKTMETRKERAKGVATCFTCRQTWPHCKTCEVTMVIHVASDVGSSVPHVLRPYNPDELSLLNAELQWGQQASVVQSRRPQSNELKSQ